MHDYYKPKQIEVEKRLLRVQRVVGENVEQKTITAKVDLPVAAIKIMDVIADLENVRGEVREDGVMVTGIIHKQVFFVDQGDLVRHVPEDIPFRIFVDVEGADPHMRAQVDASIEDVSWSLEHHGMRVKQDIVVRVFAKVTETEQVEVVVDVPGVEVITEHLRVESVVGETTERETITPTITLPMPAVKIFDIKAEVRDVTFDIKRDTVLVRGTIHKQIFFVDKTNVVRHFPEDVTFSIGVDIPGATDDMDAQVDVDVFIDDWRLVGGRDHDKDKDRDRKDHDDDHHHGFGQELRQTVVVEAFVKVVEPLQLDVVVDVPGFEVETMLLKVDEVVAHVKDSETIDADVTLPMDAIKVYSIMASIRNLRYEIRDGTVVVRGVIHKQIFYVDSNNLLRHFPEDVPFSIAVDVPGAEPDMRAFVRARINGDIDWSLGRRNTVMQSVLVAVDVKVTQEVQLEVVTDVLGDVEDTGVCPPGSKTHVVQQGETMWSIAQSYSVPMDALIRANPQIKDPDHISVGMRVCIPPKWKG